MKFHIHLALASALAAGSLEAADWPNYRGPNHNGVSSERLGAWPKAGPKQLWKIPMNAGFSSIAVAGNLATTLVLRDVDGVKREVCLGLDANTGKELWATTLAVAKYDGGGDDGKPENKGGDGPRSTPAIDAGNVYVLDAKLMLSCLDAKTGKQKWARDIAADHKAMSLRWQNAASPLVVGDLIFVAAGGKGESLLGISKADGKTVWKGEDDAITHATPTHGTIHGQPQVIFYTQKGLVSVEPKSGKVLWRHPYQFSVSTAASPIIAGDIVYCSAGYGVGAGAARITKSGDTWKAEEIWRTRGNSLANHWSTPVLKDGKLYGMFQFKEYGTGAVKCVDVATGETLWSAPDFGPGNVTLVGDKLLLLTDYGDLVLADAKPDKYNELARFKAVEGKCWTTPTLANGRIYVRSTKEGACYATGQNLSAR